MGEIDGLCHRCQGARYELQVRFGEAGVWLCPACFEKAKEQAMEKKAVSAVRVFVCSPFRAIGGNTIEDNIDLVKRLCRAVALAGYAPYAPHLYCPLFLNDTIESEREAGIKIGHEFMKACQQLWVYDQIGISTGMHRDIGEATQLGLKIDGVPKLFEHISPKRAP